MDDGKEFDAASATYTLPSTDPFVVTGAGSFYTGSREWAVSSINYALRVYKPGQPAAEDGQSEQANANMEFSENVGEGDMDSEGDLSDFSEEDILLILVTLVDRVQDHWHIFIFIGRMNKRANIFGKA